VLYQLSYIFVLPQIVGLEPTATTLQVYFKML